MKEITGQNFEDKLKFINQHKDEIRPIASEPKVVDEIAEGKIVQPEGRVDKIIEEFENKIFICEKKEYKRGAKRVLITVDNPGPFNNIKGIVSALLKDDRCKSIAVVTGGVSNKAFASEFGDQFQLVRDGDKLLLDDFNQISSEDNPIDITIGSVSSENGPESVALWSGKPIFGAKKTFLIFGEWGGLGSNFNEKIKNSEEGKKAIAQIDGIFCNDDLAKRILRQHLPDFPPEKIFDTGTPALDSLELPRAEELRQLGRAKLGLRDDDFAVLYLGDCGNYPEYGCDPALNVETFKKTLTAVIGLAKENPELKFAFLLRPHPRDPEKDKSYEFVKQTDLPANLKVVSATREVVTMNEAAYAADVTTSLVSTENILAPLRGNNSIFLAFEEKGFGKQVVEGLYEPSIIKSMKDAPGIFMANSPEDLREIILKLRKYPENRPRPKDIGRGTVNGILNKIFE